MGYFITPKIGQLFHFCSSRMTPETHLYAKNGHFLGHFRAENGQKMAKSYFFTHWPNPSPDAPTISRDQVIWIKNLKMGAEKASWSPVLTPLFESKIIWGPNESNKFSVQLRPKLYNYSGFNIKDDWKLESLTDIFVFQNWYLFVNLKSDVLAKLGSLSIKIIVTPNTLSDALYVTRILNIYNVSGK